jgi:hypothetical protein
MILIDWFGETKNCFEINIAAGRTKIAFLDGVRGRWSVFTRNSVFVIHGTGLCGFPLVDSRKFK